MLKKIINGQLVIILLVLSPLIDIITSLMTVNGINFTLGLFIKGIILVLAVIYLLFVDTNNKKYSYFLIGLLALQNILNIINNVNLLSTHLFSYSGYLMKFDFMVIMLLFFIKYFKNNKFDIRVLKIPIIIVCLSIVISKLTGTAINTYDEIRVGTSSWFHAGNEFGALLSIMYPIAIYLFLDRKQSRKIDVIYVLIIAYGLLEIGTKVGLLSFYITSVFYIIIRLINCKKYRLNYAFGVIILLLCASFACFNHLPTVQNIKLKYAENSDIADLFTSGRIEYLKYVMNSEHNLYDYISGKANLMDNALLLIELDLFDMFFMFGIVGTGLLYGMAIFVAIKIFAKYKKNLLSGLKYAKVNMLVLAIALALFISMTAGHVILCPSVSIYVSVICGYLASYGKFEKEEKDKKKILIGAVHAKLGGIERTLINLLNVIDYEKYEVDVMLMLKNGELINDFPREVKIITPYSESFNNFFARESKISKVFKHLLFNKYTAWLWTNNKFYDVSIDYSGYYLFTDYYVAYSNSKKKYIWVHQNVYGSQKYDKNFNKNFLNNLNKYKRYDKIVCVSDSAKADLDKMIPKYQNKTVVINNILEAKCEKGEKVSLKGKYKLISVGRICPQKGYERLVLVHQKLIKEGYDITTYLVGDGKELADLKNQVKELDLEKSFIFLGAHSNVYDYIRACDLFVSTTHCEAYPTVFFETLLCQKPWVAPNVAGVSDVAKVSPKKSYIMTEDSVDGIKEGIKEAINGKVNDKFTLDIEKLNKKTLNDFYQLIEE